MALDSIEALRVFVQVVDSGQLGAAGRILGLARTLVSRRIARLEDELGVQLLVRTTRSLRVTDEGEEFYRRCRRILAEVEDASQAVRTVVGEVRGTVRARLPTVMASPRLQASLRVLLESNPRLNVQLSFSDQPVDLVAGGWDIAVLAGPPPDSTHIARRVARMRPGLAATPEYLARAGIPQRPEDLAEHECLRFISDRPQDTWTLINDVGTEQEVPVHGRLESDNSAALRDAMLAGVGIGLVSSVEIASAVDEGRLVHVLPDWTMAPFTLYSLTPAGRTGIPRIRHFSEWIRAYLLTLQ